MTIRLRFIDKQTGKEVTVSRVDFHGGYIRTVWVEGQEWSIERFEVSLESDHN